jgi:hypothetical protein
MSLSGVVKVVNAFLLTDVAVIAFADLVVVAHNADAVHDVARRYLSLCVEAVTGFGTCQSTNSAKAVSE